MYRHQLSGNKNRIVAEVSGLLYAFILMRASLVRGSSISGGLGYYGFANKEAILAMKLLLIGEDPFNVIMLCGNFVGVGVMMARVMH